MRAPGRPRVLVCDDEETVRLICERALARAGLEPRVFGSGRAALEAAGRETFDAFVLDVRMPGIDGPRLLEELRTEDPDTPCLVISGYADFDAAVALLRGGATDFLRKPFDVADLVAGVRRALERRRLQVDSVLLAATPTIFSSLDAQTIVVRVLEVVRSLLRATPAIVYAGPGGADLELPAAVARLLEQRDAVILEAGPDAELIAALAPGAREIVAQPLVAGDRALGLLHAARASGARGFGEADLQRLALLAGHIALALENGRLHAESRAQAYKLERTLDRLVVAERIAAISRLAAGLGHEIANPASAVLAHLEVARDMLAGGRPDDVRLALARADLGARAILDICQALRPLGAGDQRVQPTPLGAVVDGALRLLSHELRGRARVIVTAAARDAVVLADPAKLGQVLLNVLLNAAQAIPAGAPDENEVRIDAGTAAADVVVTIADTGAGVPPDLADRIFEPSVSSKPTGLGMGLAMCRWILEDMGGTIRALPRPRGALFEIRLRAA
jgi:signal transduction histidine kinase